LEHKKSWRIRTAVAINRGINMTQTTRSVIEFRRPEETQRIAGNPIGSFSDKVEDHTSYLMKRCPFAYGKRAGHCCQCLSETVLNPSFGSGGRV
jgi:hypothetical protein